MYVGVDVGGTKVLAVTTAADGTVLSSASVATPGRLSTVAGLEDALTEAVEKVVGRRNITAVGVSAAGLVDASGDYVRFATHLPWRDDPVRSRLVERWRAPVVVENDAACAAIAELNYGAARHSWSSVLITVGTGIGGAVVVDHRLWRGADGMAGEFGHMRLVPGGVECECGLRGCWEQYCSGRALQRLVREATGEDVDGPEISTRALAGDPVALAAFTEVGEWLGVGAAGLVSAFDPGLIIVGGGVSAIGEPLLEPARAALHDNLIGADHRRVPQIVQARFGPEAGAVGAAQLARRSRVERRRRRGPRGLVASGSPGTRIRRRMQRPADS